MPERHQSQKNSRASSYALLLEQPGDKQKYQSAHQAVSDLMDDAEEKGYINVTIDHQDVSQPGEEKRKKKDLLIEPRIESHENDRQAGKGKKEQRNRDVEGKLEIVQIEVGFQKRTVHCAFCTPVEGEGEDKDRKQNRLFIDEIKPVLLQGDQAELFLPDIPGEYQNNKEKTSIHIEEKTKVCEIDQSPSGNSSSRCAQSQTKGQCAVFSVEVHTGLILVVKAVRRDIQGVVGYSQKEEYEAQDIKILSEDQKQK